MLLYFRGSNTKKISFCLLSKLRSPVGFMVYEVVCGMEAAVSLVMVADNCGYATEYSL